MAYDRARPGYPHAAVAQLVHQLGVGPASVVLDLAAGTGKLTRTLEPLVGRVVAVEPSEAMRSALQRSLPRLEAMGGTAEALPFADASVDAAFVAEAFHWFRAEEASREIARVLRSGAGLALLWNRSSWKDRENPWLADFRALVEPHRAAAGGPWPNRPAEAERALESTGLFEPATREATEHVQRLGTDEFVALVSSWSWIANLPDDERVRVLRRVGELVGENAELELRYVTETNAMRKR